MIDDIDKAVMGIVEKRAIPLELLIYAQAACLEQTKHVGLDLGYEQNRRRGKREMLAGSTILMSEIFYFT